MYCILFKNENMGVLLTGRNMKWTDTGTDEEGWASANEKTRFVHYLITVLPTKSMFFQLQI